MNTVGEARSSGVRMVVHFWPSAASFQATAAARTPCGVLAGGLASNRPDEVTCPTCRHSRVFRRVVRGRKAGAHGAACCIHYGRPSEDCDCGALAAALARPEVWTEGQLRRWRLWVAPTFKGELAPTGYRNPNLHPRLPLGELAHDWERRAAEASGVEARQLRACAAELLRWVAENGGPSW